MRKFKGRGHYPRIMNVIIFSRGREKQLLKTLKYMNQKNINTLVFHNSPKPLGNLEQLSNIRYVLAQMPISGRFRLASEYIENNENYIICSDDEIFTCSSLAKSDEILNCNTLVTSVVIPAIGVAIGKKGFHISSAYASMRGYNNLGNRLENRLDYHFNQRVGLSSYQGAMYRAVNGVHMKELLTLMGKMENISTPYVYEIIAEIYLTYAGQTSSIDESGWIRNWIEEPIHDKNWDRDIYFSDWWTEPKYATEVRSFRNEMKSFIQVGHNQRSEELFWAKVLDGRALLENREKSQIKKHNWRRYIFRKLIYSFYRKVPRRIRGRLLEIALHKSGLTQNTRDIANGVLQVLT
jgi:hypothetical protein